MIVQDDFLSKLKDFGLNSYEAKIWTALLSRGVSTAGELSDIANVPRSRSYDVLESLEKKGFIIMKLGKPIKYIAVSPEEVIERVKKKIDNDTKTQLKMLNELKNSSVFEELSMLHSQGVEMVDPTELTGSFRGRDSIYNHLNSAIKSAQKSITLLTTETGLIRKAKQLSRNLAKAADKGVRVKIAAPITSKNEEVAKTLAKFADVRHVDDPGRMLIVDDKNLTFMLADDKDVHASYDSGVWVSTPYFASKINQLIQGMWNNLKQIK